MAVDIEDAPQVAELYALVRKLEARARREHDSDLARAGVLLRLLMGVIASDDQEAVIRQHEGRLH
jgi:hypothetical protein